MTAKRWCIRSKFSRNFLNNTRRSFHYHDGVLLAP